MLSALMDKGVVDCELEAAVGKIMATVSCAFANGCVVNMVCYITLSIFEKLELQKS